MTDYEQMEEEEYRYQERRQQDLEWYNATHCVGCGCEIEPDTRVCDDCLREEEEWQRNCYGGLSND